MKLLLESWRQYINEGNYSFDYDSTLIKYRYEYDQAGDIEDVVYDGPHEENIKTLRGLAAQGHTIYIVTSRTLPPEGGFAFEDPAPTPAELVKELGLPVDGIYFTNGALKIFTLAELGVSKHWDDDQEEIDSIVQYNRSHQENPIEFELVPVQAGLTENLREKYKRLLLAEDLEVLNYLYREYKGQLE